MIRSLPWVTPLSSKGVDREPLSICGARWLGRSAWTRARRFFLCRGLHADDHDGFAELAHTLRHVGSVWGLPIPAGDEHAGLLLARSATNLKKQGSSEVCF